MYSTFDAASQTDILDQTHHNTATELVLSSNLSLAGRHPVEGAFEDIERGGTTDRVAPQDRGASRSVRFHHFDRSQRVIDPEDGVVHGEIDRQRRGMDQRFRNEDLPLGT